jgi:hypothetical protein
MLPLLKQGRDIFTVRKKTADRCKKYDVVLYRRPPNKYVLHRIVKVCEDSYVIRGDNCISNEYGIKDSDIIGVMTCVVRNGREISADSTGFRLYSRVWCALFPIRKSLLLARRAFGKIVRGIGDKK